MTNIQKANQLKALGNQAFKSKKYVQAINYFTQAIEQNPNDHTFFSNRSNSYVNTGDYQKALDDANTCIKLNPTWAKGYQRKGTALFYLNKSDEAITAYKQGLKIQPNNQQIKSDLQSVQNKKMQMSQQFLQAYMKLMNNPQTKDLLSDKDFMHKIQMILQNPSTFPMFANDPRIQKAADVISKSNFNFQDFMKNMDKQKTQQSPSNKSQKMQQQIPSPKKQQKTSSPKKKSTQQLDQAQITKNQGNNQYKKKNFQKAIQLYQQAIDLKPTQPLYYNNKAAAYLQLGQYTKAHQQIDKAQKIFQDGLKDYAKKAKVLARRASLFAKQGKYDQAISTYQKSLVQDQVQKIRDQLKNVKKLKKQKDQKDYINPDLAQKACETGNALFKQGKFPQALKQYQQAIKRNPQVAKYYSNLGTGYIKLMQWNRARQNFDIAIKKQPTYIKAYPKKGDCHFAMKQYHKALQTYEAGLKIDSTNQLCKQGLTKTQNAIYTSGSTTTQQQKMQRAQRAMSDPQIKKILQTPQVMNALQDLQNNPAAIQNIMKNPDLAMKIEKLIQAGVLGTA